MRKRKPKLFEDNPTVIIPDYLQVSISEENLDSVNTTSLVRTANIMDITNNTESQDQ